jgi:hypothetical protein
LGLVLLLNEIYTFSFQGFGEPVIYSHNEEYQSGKNSIKDLSGIVKLRQFALSRAGAGIFLLRLLPDLPHRFMCHQIGHIDRTYVRN